MHPELLSSLRAEEAARQRRLRELQDYRTMHPNDPARPDFDDLTEEELDTQLEELRQGL